MPYHNLLSGLHITLVITAFAIIVGLFLGAMLAFVRSAEVPVLNQAAQVYVNVFRATPLVMVLLGFYLVAPGLIRAATGFQGDVRLASALIAFALFEAAYFCEILRAGIKAVPLNQVSAAGALGMTKLQTFRHVVLPQALRNARPVVLTQCLIVFQDSALATIIGLTDFFQASVKAGEASGRLTEWILGASAAYAAVFVAVQLIANRLSKHNNQKGEVPGVQKHSSRLT